MRILLVDDDKNSREAVKWFLVDQGHIVTECASGEEALAKYSSDDFPMVLSDIKMPGMSGIELLSSIKKQPENWRTDVVLFTGYADTQTAVAALREGAYDYLSKPVDAQELAAVVDRIAEHQNLLRENKLLSERFQEEVNAATEEAQRELSQIRQLATESAVDQVGVFSPELSAVMDLAMQFHRDRTITALIEGETGTGKEVVAKTIHFGDGSGEMARRPFVDINCAAIVPSLFESELFGYESGAFTGGAPKGQKGKLDMAQGGTLFFDEVGEIPLELQGKLLRLLQENEYYRVGGLKKIKTDIRFIFACNYSLEQRVAEGRFRKDLYYRLKIGYIYLPPLRDRREDIIPLATMFLCRFARQKGKKFSGITPEARELLARYDWPGNVRELKNVMEFATFLYDAEELAPCHVSGLLSKKEQECYSAVTTGNQIVLPLPPNGYSLKNYNDDIIKAVLAAHDDNQTASAQYLGISLRALAYRVAKIRKQKSKA